MSFELPNLTLLRQFVVTAEEGSISRAARRLRISQPALSKNIHKLEDLLGTQLFVRHSGGAELTSPGSMFFEKAQIIGLEYQYAVQELRNYLSDQEATIRIGAGPVWSSTILPVVVEQFHSLFSRHRLQVLTGSVDKLSEDLRLGRIDIFAGALTNSSKLPGFAVKSLARSEMVIFAAEEHPLMKGDPPVSMNDIVEHPFVAFVPQRDIIDLLTVYSKRHGAPPPRFLLETSSIYACVELVRSGKYLIYETRMIANTPIGKGLVELPLAEPIHKFDIGIVYRDGLERLPPYRRLMGIMSDVLMRTVGHL